MVMFASDSTRSIQEMIQLGRALWPRYAVQLQLPQVRAAMTNIGERLKTSVDDVLSLEENKTKIEDEFVRLWGSRFYIHLKTLSRHNNITCLALNETGAIPSTHVDETVSDESTPHSQVHSIEILDHGMFSKRQVHPINISDPEMLSKSHRHGLNVRIGIYI
jgi:hypothetical protein